MLPGSTRFRKLVRVSVVLLALGIVLQISISDPAFGTVPLQVLFSSKESGGPLLSYRNFGQDETLTVTDSTTRNATSNSLSQTIGLNSSSSVRSTTFTSTQTQNPTAHINTNPTNPFGTLWSTQRPLLFASAAILALLAVVVALSVKRFKIGRGRVTAESEDEEENGGVEMEDSGAALPMEELHVSLEIEDYEDRTSQQDEPDIEID